MWKWTCPKQPKLEYEHHSWSALNEHLTLHEDGFVSDLLSIEGCDEEHEYWDDGNPCGHPKCQKRYIRNDEPVDDVGQATLNRSLS